MSTEEHKAGDDAVVLLGKKLDDFIKKYETDKSEATRKMDGIQSLLGKVSVAPPETHEKGPAIKSEEDEEPKKKEDETSKKLEEFGKKLDELPANLAKALGHPKKEEDEEEAKKEEVKEEKKEEDEEEAKKEEDGDADGDEPDADDEPPKAKAKVKAGAKVADVKTIVATTSDPEAWWKEIRAVAIEKGVIEG